MASTNERTPLVRAPTAGSPSHCVVDQDRKPGTTPVPWVQVTVLCIARMLDGWFFFSISPYIGEMLISVGIPEERIGFYAGLVESIYSASECFFLLYVWTDLSNRIGRKPVLLICLMGITIGGTLFGFSRTVWQMVLSRTIAGMFSGCIGMIRIMMAELTDSSNRAPAFAFFSAVGYFPLLIGPVCGGALSRPADRYALFKDVLLFHKFPYLLPSLLMGVFGAVITLTSAVFLKETRHPGIRKEDNYAPSTASILRSPGVAYTLILLSVSSGMIFAWTAIFPIFMFTSVNLGGLSFSVSQISYMLAVLAVLQLLNTVVIFPLLYRRKGIFGILKICGALLTGICLVAPLCNLAARAGWSVMTWICIACTGVVAAGSTILFTTKALAVNDASPSPQALAKVNSLSLVLTMAMRAVAPSLASSIFATGVQYRILKGQLVWLLLGGVGVAWCLALKHFPQKQGSQQEPVDEVREDDDPV